MPEKGKYTAADAVKNGVVPAAPFGRVIDQWVSEHWWLDDRAENLDGERMVSGGAVAVLAAATGIHRDTLRKVRAGKKEWLEFDNADRIVTFVDPWLWRTDPELSDIYQGFDFTYLDLSRPTSPEADPLKLVDGIGVKHAAAILGVCKTSVFRYRKQRATAAA